MVNKGLILGQPKREDESEFEIINRFSMSLVPILTLKGKFWNTAKAHTWVKHKGELLIKERGYFVANLELWQNEESLLEEVKPRNTYMK